MVERQGQSELGSPKKQGHRCEIEGDWQFLEEIGRKKKAILNWGDLGRKRDFVVIKELFFSFFPYFSSLGKEPGELCWEKPNWGGTGDEKGFSMVSWGRGLEK